MILQKSIQEVIEAAKVEDVVGDFVSLKNRGVNMLGLCPFHNEKTPSFTVSPQKNIYKCFGCGEAGNPISFIMAHEGLSFPEAIRYLAKKYGIQLEETGNKEEHQKERQLIDSLYIVNEFALKYYQDQLLNTDLGKSIGLSYFKERGFREETIKKFGLGYAPGAGDFFTKAATQKKYSSNLLKKVGLSNQYGKDFFRGRVMFPIKNLSGKVIGFGGRILGNNKKTAKYMNTPETEIYNKSKVLYGIHYAKKAIRQKDECILVEGYTDVISLNQSGIENVVAASGTALTEEQVRLIQRYSSNITILLDSDNAGLKAGIKGIKVTLERLRRQRDINIYGVTLPSGEDPDSYLKKVGTTRFREYFKNNKRLFVEVVGIYFKNIAGSDPIKIVEAINKTSEFIALIPAADKRDSYLKLVAKIFNLNIRETNRLVHDVNKLVHKDYKRYLEEQKDIQPVNTVSENNTSDRPPTKDKTSLKPNLDDEFQEKDVVRLLLEVGHEELEDGETVAQTVLADMGDLLNSFDNKLYGKFVNLYHHMLNAQDNHPTQQQFLNHLDTEIQKLSINILAFPYDYSKNWVEKHEKPLESRAFIKQFYKNDMLYAMNRFKLKKLIKMYKQNQERLKGIPSSNLEEMMRILKVQKRLGELRGKLAVLMNTVVLE